MKNVSTLTEHVLFKKLCKLKYKRQKKMKVYLHYKANKSIGGIVNTCKCKTCETCLTETTLTDHVKYQIENKPVVFVKCLSQCILF